MANTNVSTKVVTGEVRFSYVNVLNQRALTEAMKSIRFHFSLTRGTQRLLKQLKGQLKPQSRQELRSSAVKFRPC